MQTKKLRSQFEIRISDGNQTSWINKACYTKKFKVFVQKQKPEGALDKKNEKTSKKSILYLSIICKKSAEYQGQSSTKILFIRECATKI